MKKNKDDATPSEARIQQEICMWYRNAYCLEHHNPRCMIFSIPNEGRGAASSQLIQTGLYPGCADLFISHDKGEEVAPYESWFPDVMFFEIKTMSGKQSPKQKKFEAHCDQMDIPYYIVRSLDEFKQVIEKL